MPFQITYQDYINSLPTSSEGGSLFGNGAITEDDWNGLSPLDRAQRLQGGGMSSGMSVGVNDPRYQGLLDMGVKPETGRPIDINAGQFNPNHNIDSRGRQLFKDPSQPVNGDGYYLSSGDMMTPQAQEGADAGMEDWQKALFAASLFGGAFLGAGAAGAAGAGSSAPAMSTSIGGGFGTGALGAGGTGASFGTAFSAANAAGGAAGAGGAGSGSQGINYGDPMQQYPTPQSNAMGPDFNLGSPTSAPTGSASGFGNTPQGVFAPGMENAAQADSWLINNGMSGAAGGNMTGLLGGGVGDMAGNVGSWAMKNPLQAYGLVQTAGGLLSRGGSNSGGPSSSGGGSKGGNGTGVSTKLDRPQFQPNPYLLAQLQRGGYQYP